MDAMSDVWESLESQDYFNSLRRVTFQDVPDKPYPNVRRTKRSERLTALEPKGQDQGTGQMDRLEPDSLGG